MASRERPVPPHQRAAGGDPACHLAEILERHRHPVQRAQGHAGAGLAVARLGDRHGLVPIDRDEGVQLGVGGANARQAIGGERGRAQIAHGDHGRQAVGRKGDELFAKIGGHAEAPCGYRRRSGGKWAARSLGAAQVPSNARTRRSLT